MIAERDFERVNNRPKKNKTTDAEIAEYEKRKSITQLDPTDNRGLANEFNGRPRKTTTGHKNYGSH